MARSNNKNSTQQQQQNANRFDDRYTDLQSSDQYNTTEWMEEMDFDSVYTMEKQAHDYIIDPFDSENNTNDDADDDTTQKSTTNLKTKDEQVLSQKFSQLSTTTTNEKLITIKDIEDEMKKIPTYLSKRNPTFQHTMQQIVSTMTSSSTTMHMEDLREIAILIYKTIYLRLYHDLWTTYLKSGMGQLMLPSPKQFNFPIWPKEIKTSVQSPIINETNENEIYVNFVNQHLHEFNHQLKRYEKELNIKLNHFPSYALTLQQMIETYIEQNLHQLRMKIEHQIQLIHYDYHIRALKLEYIRSDPNTDQKQLMKELCQSRYEQETTEQELNLLKQQITYYNSSSQSFECSSISHSSCLDSIQNSTIRQQLFQQYKQIAEQTKADLFGLYLKTAEDQRNEYRKKFDVAMKKMWSDRQSATEKDKIPLHLIQLIEQRGNKISERIQYIYKFKAQSLVFNVKPSLNK